MLELAGEGLAAEGLAGEVLHGARHRFFVGWAEVRHLSPAWS